MLIVEDEGALRRALVEEFSEAGFTTYEAADGQEGVTQARTVHPDIIILDLLMPRMRGEEMINEVQGESWMKDVPVIILTNLAMGDKRIKDVVAMNPAWYLMKSDQSLHGVVEKARSLLTLADAKKA